MLREGHTRIATVTLNYADISANNKLQTSTVELAAEVTRDKALVDAGENKSVIERIEEVRVAKAMTEAADLLKQGRGKEARNVLRAQRKRTKGMVNRVGGSQRLSNQVRQLDNLTDQFRDAEEAPGKAAGVVKKVKASARKQAR